MKSRLPNWRAVVACVAPVLSGEAQEPPLFTLPDYVVAQPRVANTAPVATYDMLVSGLRFEPFVDVQSRNMAEGQADVSVRGGIFENTGFRVGGASLFDPQTGHYFAEIPVSPAMLSPVEVMTGVENALAGFNSSVATLRYRWRPVTPRGEASLGVGEFGLRRADVYQGAALRERGESSMAADFSAAWSRGDGSLPGGDHEFARYSGRLQLRRGGAQTDLFAGYQSKFFGWPNLYTPFGFLETENIKTTLVLLNHRVERGGDGYVEASAIWRRNADDYEFDRTRPGAGNPFEHETRVLAAAIEARVSVGEDTAIQGRAELVGDSIESTSLLFAGFDSRTYFKGSLAGEHSFRGGGGEWTLLGGMAFDDDNRGGSKVSPVFELAHTSFGRGRRIFIQVSGASQVPGYTAIGSPAASGLFRGNRDLGRERSTNWEVGIESRTDRWTAQASLFFRQDRDLVDWTFRQGVTARSANAVDIDTVGLEATVARQWPRGRVVVGYTWLDKDADYRGLAVDASFYALNFARHRMTVALILNPAKWVELRMDNEFRIQEPNVLRVGDDEAFITSLGVHFFPSQGRNLEISVVADNLWNDRFEELPSVPAARRQVSANVAFRW